MKKECCSSTRQRSLTEESLAESAEAVLRGHETSNADHEVRVPLKIAQFAIEPVEVIPEELGILVIAAKGSELGEPNGPVSTDAMDLVKVIDERLGLIGRRVPMRDAKVNLATRRLARRHEALQPPSSLTVEVAVRDSRGTDARAASVRVNVLDMSSSSSLGRKISLRCVVGLIEAKNMARALAQALLDVSGPAVRVIGPVAPEHGHELDAAGEPVADGVPVVGPGAAGAAVDEVVDEVGVVVGEASLSA